MDNKEQKHARVERRVRPENRELVRRGVDVALYQLQGRLDALEERARDRKEERHEEKEDRARHVDANGVIVGFDVVKQMFDVGLLVLIVLAVVGCFYLCLPFCNTSDYALVNFELNTTVCPTSQEVWLRRFRYIWDAYRHRILAGEADIDDYYLRSVDGSFIEFVAQAKYICFVEDKLPYYVSNDLTKTLSRAVWMFRPDKHFVRAKVADFNVEFDYVVCSELNKPLMCTIWVFGCFLLFCFYMYFRLDYPVRSLFYCLTAVRVWTVVNMRPRLEINDECRSMVDMHTPILDRDPQISELSLRLIRHCRDVVYRRLVSAVIVAELIEKYGFHADMVEFERSARCFVRQRLSNLNRNYTTLTVVDDTVEYTRDLILHRREESQSLRFGVDF